MAVPAVGRKFDYSLIVIGSGAAGTAAALVAAKNVRGKKKIALVEAEAWGGSTLCTRDVPFGAALEFSHAYARARNGAQLGLSSGNLRYNLTSALQWRNSVVRKSGGESKKLFEDAGIDCIKGQAHFLNPYEIGIGSRKVAAPRYILATGARIDMGSIEGTDKVECLTPETAMRLPRLPKAIAVIGAGSTGCEVANYFAELGTKVILLEQAERILPREDKEAGALLEQYFTKRLGMKILVGARVVGVDRDEKSKKVIFETNAGEKTVRTETVVLANGAIPVTDYGLENARVKFSRGGIRVDRGLQTSSKHIWAAGDAVGGGESSYEKAGYEGTIAAGNAVRHAKNLINYGGFMRVTNTYPQIAKVGVNEVDCAAAKIKGVRKGIVTLQGIAAAQFCGFNVGFVKFLTDKQGKLLGATVMAPEASLMTQEIALAIRHGINVTELAATPHSGFGWGEAIQEAIRRIR